MDYETAMDQGQAIGREIVRGNKDLLIRLVEAQERQADALEQIARVVGDVKHDGTEVSNVATVAEILHNLVTFGRAG